VFISLLDPLAHAPVWDAYLVELRPVDPESKPFVEAYGVGLSVKVYLRESQFCGLVHEMAHYPAADPAAAVLRQHCDAPDLARRLQPAGADCITFRGAGEHVPAHRIGVVPFVGLRDALLDDKNGPPHALDGRAVFLPGRAVDYDSRRRRTIRHRGPAWRRGRCNLPG
jgi:hypothetical protein